MQEHKAYANHVCVQRYMEPEAGATENQASAEISWPGHRDTVRLAATPRSFECSASTEANGDSMRAEGRRWQREFHEYLDYVIERRERDAAGLDRVPGERQSEHM